MEKVTEVQSKVFRARSTMVLETATAFYASLMLRKPMIEDYSIKRAATDGTSIRYNPKFFAGLTVKQIIGVIVHELMHIYFFHHTRRNGRDLKMWNKAADYVINIMIIDAGLELPDDCLLDYQYRNMTAEAVYDMLKKQKDKEEQEKKEQEQQQQQQDDQQEEKEDQGGQQNDQDDKGDEQDESDEDQDEDADGDSDGDGDPDEEENDSDQEGDTGDSDDDQDDNDNGQDDGEDGQDGQQDDAGEQAEEDDDWDIGEVEDAPAQTKEELQEVELEVKQQLAQALAIGKQQGNLPADLEKMIEEMLQPVVNWHEVLARFMVDNARNDYSFRRPNRRYLQTGFMLPSLHSVTMGDVALFIDTSISVFAYIELLNKFASEMQSISDAFNCRMIAIHVDTRVQKVDEFEPNEAFDLVPKGGGGTDFRPAFEYIKENDIEPSCIIYFTDGYCSSFPDEPDQPVLWATYGNRNFLPPFGEVIFVD